MTEPKSLHLVKKATEIVLKGVIKGAVAVSGIPGDVVDVVAAIVLKYLANPNDSAVAEKFKQLQEEITLELAARSEQYKDGRPPSSDDVEKGLIRFATAYKNAGSHHKRRVLFNAFHNSFRPEFYDEGLAQILWDKVDDLQYPDLNYLKKILDSRESRSATSPVFMQGGKEYEYLKRLEDRRLVMIGDPTQAGRQVLPLGLAPELVRFALEEIWKEDTETCPIRGTSDRSGEARPR